MGQVVYDIAPVPPHRRGQPAPTWPERQAFFESIRRMLQPLTVDEQERALNLIVRFYREQLDRLHPDWTLREKENQSLDFCVRLLDQVGLEIVPRGSEQ